MNLIYIKNSSEKCMEILDNIYKALNTLTLTSYSQQKTNINCMEALQQVYAQLKEINEEVSNEKLKDNSKG
jgi:hypothetical protein